MVYIVLVFCKSYVCFTFYVGWIISFSEQVLTLCKLRCNDTTAKVNFCVTIRPDFTWVVTYCNNIVDMEECAVLKRIPPVMNSGTKLSFLIVHNRKF